MRGATFKAIPGHRVVARLGVAWPSGARCGGAKRGAAPRGGAWSGVVGQGEVSKAVHHFTRFENCVAGLGEAMHGLVRHAEAGHGRARRGFTSPKSFPPQYRLGLAGRRMAWRGVVRPGGVPPGDAWRCVARPGVVWRGKVSI